MRLSATPRCGEAAGLAVVGGVLPRSAPTAPRRARPPARAAAIAVIGTPAAFFNVYGGQNAYFTAALLAGGLLVLDRRPVIGGICFGCLAYKPHMAMLVPFALAASGRWRSFAAAAAAAI